MAPKRPKYEETFDGVRVRVFTTREGIECLIGDGDIADREAEVWCYPRVIGPVAAAHQAYLDHKNSDR